MSTHLQLEELSRLLTRLRRHQARLASVRNLAVGQLLQHQLTWPTCQVSAAGLSQGRGLPAVGQQSDVLARVFSCPRSRLYLLSGSSPHSLPVCFWSLLPDTVQGPGWGRGLWGSWGGGGEPTPLVLGRGLHVP